MHTDDCKKLILLLHRLVDEGNTVIVIEHDSDIIAEADFLFELGPVGGEKGGKITFNGTTSKILTNKNSHTGPFIRKVLPKELS